MNNPLLASFHDKDALLTKGSEQSFSAYLDSASAIIAKIETGREQAAHDTDFWFAPDDWRSTYRPYVVADGVLYVPVKGVLLHGMAYALGDYATGYVYLTKAIERGLDDPEVKRIVMVIDSGGGHVSGCFDLGDRIYAGRSVKPIHAVADEFAYSAAYLIASSCTDFKVARTGGAGSIGVLRVHYDMSRAVEAAGVTVTFIQSGAHKTDEHPLKPLSEAAQARLQARSAELYEIFVSTVARNRSMDAQAVRDTEALTFSAAEAVSNGLADSIGTLDDAIAAFAADLSNQEDDTMSTKDTSAVDQAAVETARAEGHAAGVKEGANAERARFAAIVNSEAGQARPKAAMKFATNDKFAAIDADAITEMLADMPEEKAAAPAPKNDAQAPKGKDGAAADFMQTMNTAEHPEAGSPAAKTEEQARADRRKNAAMAAGRLRAVE